MGRSAFFAGALGGRTLRRFSGSSFLRVLWGGVVVGVAEVPQVLFRLSRWENWGHAEEV